MVPTWWRSLNPTSSADSSSCVATAMWRSTPVRSSSSCSERLRPTESGMKIRGKTTVDFSGSTGRRGVTAPSTFNAGTSPTATQYSPPTGKSRLSGGPELPWGEAGPVGSLRPLHYRVFAGCEAHFSFGPGRQLHGKDLAGRLRARRSAANLRVALRFFQIPDPAILHEESL